MTISMKKTNILMILFVALLALTMTLGLFSSGVSASGSSITQINEDQYTTFLNAVNRNITVYATTTNTYADNIPFSTEAEALDVDWGWTTDGSTIYDATDTDDGQLSVTATGAIASGDLPASVVPKYAPTGTGYYAYATVHLNTWLITPASHSLVAELSAYNYANYTVAIQSILNYSAKSATVRVVDATTNTTLISDAAVSVRRSNYSNSYVLYNKGDAYQRNASAMGVLDTLKAASTINDFTVNDLGSYADTLTINNVSYGPTGAPGYYGWQYGVYRNLDDDPALERVPIGSTAATAPCPPNGKG